MWQTVLVLVLVVGVLTYVIRHYARVFRSEAPTCSGCTGCSGAQPPKKKEDCREESGAVSDG